ncbi:hypothetical protein HO173_013416 [Letharia columbiana]|uniref:Uncharacterized protein n=1 Tax=Letharia columbiana TaxID=112416 RepID=A0A8H6CFD2_9LECA|nr:uncharacterized protein HO173_013416 [Letharia columbiana]KAF6222492.1 hypothetical protein HO173_013416 [Letharia columbiana]
MSSNNGDTSGELVPSTSHQAVNTPNPQSMIPGLSQDTINGLMTAFGGMMRQEMQRFEQRLERIEQFLGPALYQNPTSSPNPTPPLNSTPPPNSTLPSIEIPEQNLSHTNDSSYHTSSGHLRAKEMGYFDLQQANVEKTAEKYTEKTAEKNKSTDHSSPIQAGTLSIIPHQATMHICGEPSPRLSNTPVFATPSHLTSRFRLSARLHSIREGYGGYRPRIGAWTYGRRMLNVAIQRCSHEDVSFFSFFAGMLLRYAKASSRATTHLGLAWLGIAHICPAGT